MDLSLVVVEIDWPVDVAVAVFVDGTFDVAAFAVGSFDVAVFEAVFVFASFAAHSINLFTSSLGP